MRPPAPRCGCSPRCRVFFRKDSAYDSSDSCRSVVAATGVMLFCRLLLPDPLEETLFHAVVDARFVCGRGDRCLAMGRMGFARSVFLRPGNGLRRGRPADSMLGFLCFLCGRCEGGDGVAVQDLTLLVSDDDDVTVESLHPARYADFVLKGQGHRGLIGHVRAEHPVEK